MKRITSSAIHEQSGAMSSAVVALAALGGFAAGALLVALAAFERSTPGTDESAGIPVQYHAPQPAVEFPVASTQAWQPSAVSGPWTFEGGTPQPRGGPGRKRPDLLSAPEGWTYDAAPTH
jgi:hypothetical protein